MLAEVIPGLFSYRFASFSYRFAPFSHRFASFRTVLNHFRNVSSAERLVFPARVASFCSTSIFALIAFSASLDSASVSSESLEISLSSTSSASSENSTSSSPPQQRREQEMAVRHPTGMAGLTKNPIHDSLPEGWMEVASTDGVKYFHNAETGQTSWTPPTA